MKIHLHKNDLPKEINFGTEIAIDTETMGLKLGRDPLCLVQLSSGDGDAHIVQLDRKTYDAPNLKALLSDTEVTKIFHFARFDISVIKLYLGVDLGPVYCTRTASKLARTYTDRHGLRDVCKELAGIELNKQMQSSDWGIQELTQEQMNYAANDVLYLHTIKQKLTEMLVRENRMQLADDCFKFLAVRSALDLAGWVDDIFEH